MTWVLSPTQAFVVNKLAGGDVLYLAPGRTLAWTLRDHDVDVSPTTYRDLVDRGLLRQERIAGELRLVLTDAGWDAYRRLEAA